MVHWWRADEPGVPGARFSPDCQTLHDSLTAADVGETRVPVPDQLLPKTSIACEDVKSDMRAALRGPSHPRHILLFPGVEDTSTNSPDICSICSHYTYSITMNNLKVSLTRATVLLRLNPLGKSSLASPTNPRVALLRPSAYSPTPFRCFATEQAVPSVEAPDYLNDAERKIFDTIRQELRPTKLEVTFEY